MVEGIARITPADIKVIQAQTASDATIEDVIISLQSKVSTQQLPLNSKCTNCAVEGEPTGFVAYTFRGVDYNLVCPVCNGNLGYWAEDGEEAPPVNPFLAPVNTNMLPADFRQALTVFPTTTTLDALITKLQEESDVALNYDCALCEGSGFTTIQSVECRCWLCSGYLKTSREWDVDNGNVTAKITEAPSPPEVISLPPIV